MRNLIYYSIIGDGFFDLCKMSISSILKKSNTNNIDILVFCDCYTAKEIKEYNHEIITHVINDLDNPHDSSYNRYRIFEVEGIEKYNKFLYIDSDTIIIDDINKIFDFMDDDCIYTNQGYGSDLSHSNYTFGLNIDEINIIKEKNIQGINTGVFGFNNKKIEFFKGLYLFIKSANIKMDLFDQPYFGTYLFRSGEVYKNIGDPLHTPGDSSVFINNESMFNPMYNCIILHYAGNPGNSTSKYKKMLDDYSRMIL